MILCSNLQCRALHASSVCLSLPVCSLLSPAVISLCHLLYLHQDISLMSKLYSSTVPSPVCGSFLSSALLFKPGFSIPVLKIIYLFTPCFCTARQYPRILVVKENLLLPEGSSKEFLLPLRNTKVQPLPSRGTE